MTTAQISRITRPPSVEAVLGALTDETRIGQVDFTSRLSDPTDDEGTARDDLASLTAPVVDEAVEAADLDETDEVLIASDSEDGPTADIVTLVLAAPLADEATDESSGSDAGEETAGPLTKRAKRRHTRKPAPVTPAVEPTSVPASEDVAGSLPAILTDTETVLTDTDTDTDETEDLEAPASRGRRPILPEPLDLAALLDDSAGIDERPPSIDEIARLVVERMHDAELAMMRHLEAVEVETVRRAELATAQAELDAELIRLNARREAHAIVTAARRRAGEEVEADPAELEVERITESLNRFADVLDELRPSPRSGRST